VAQSALLTIDVFDPAGDFQRVVRTEAVYELELLASSLRAFDGHIEASLALSVRSDTQPSFWSRLLGVHRESELLCLIKKRSDVAYLTFIDDYGGEWRVEDDLSWAVCVEAVVSFASTRTRPPAFTYAHVP
jgi:hypothetical protein